MNVSKTLQSARVACSLTACAAVTLATGCAARLYSEPGEAYPAASAGDSIVYVDSVPANIEVYPHYYYGDGYAYYVDGRWYRRGPRGWGYYRQEPPELERQRPYVQRAPEAQRPYVRQAPPAVQAPYVVRQAPEVRREAPEARPVPGVVERQPTRPGPRRERPAEPRPAQRDERDHGR